MFETRSIDVKTLIKNSVIDGLLKYFSILFIYLPSLVCKFIKLFSFKNELFKLFLLLPNMKKF